MPHASIGEALDADQFNQAARLVAHQVRRHVHDQLVDHVVGEPDLTTEFGLDADLPAEPGEHLVDPYKDDEILFTITAANMDTYKDKLTPGQQALLATYPDTYKMHVYPTRRSAAFPQRIYEKTKEIAATARLTEGGNGVTGAVNGIPFPIPENGHQVIWNHLLRYRADSVERTLGQAAPTRGGKYTLVTFRDEFTMVYSMAGMAEEDLDNKVLYLRQEVISPARLAGVAARSGGGHGERATG